MLHGFLRPFGQRSPRLPGKLSPYYCHQPRVPYGRRIARDLVYGSTGPPEFLAPRQNYLWRCSHLYGCRPLTLLRNSPAGDARAGGCYTDQVRGRGLRTPFPKGA